MLETNDGVDDLPCISSPRRASTFRLISLGLGLNSGFGIRLEASLGLRAASSPARLSLVLAVDAFPQQELIGFDMNGAWYETGACASRTAECEAANMRWL
jgi:hypothetical protein